MPRDTLGRFCTVTECINCSAEIEGESFTYDGDSYCEECFNERFTACFKCGRTAEIDGDYIYCGDAYCEECFFDKFIQCHHCGGTVPESDSLYSDLACEYYCSNCYTECFTICEGCGEECYSDDMTYSEGQSGYYCEECFTDDYIKPWDYRPEFKLHGEGPLYFGFELEIENRKNDCENKGIAEEITNSGLPLYCKADGSLDDGFEIVSYPFDWEYYKNHLKKQLGEVFKLRERGFRSYDTTSCGIHIHLSKDAFTSYHLYKFLRFIYDNPTLIHTISQRKGEHLEEWANVTPDKPSEMPEGYQKKILGMAKDKRGNVHRYVAVNLQNDASIEVRIFRGTLVAESFNKNLEFCLAAFEFTLSESAEQLLDSRFVKYVQTNQESYKNLYAFLERKELI